MLENHHATAPQLADIAQVVEHELAGVVAFAEAGTPEPVAELEPFVLMDSVPQDADAGRRT